MKLAGILPTVEYQIETLSDVINRILNQTLKCDLFVVFQGDFDHFNTLKQNLSNLDLSLYYCPERSLARSKNFILNSVSINYDYFFIYEDDVEYPEDYNKNMLHELNFNSADMISCVERTKPTIRNRLRNWIFRVSHPKPLNDKDSSSLYREKKRLYSPLILAVVLR